jgi:Reverse transcriptase (RNA-dependent DNA polymerase)/Endonuclease/Exonuclease/phosphatase family
MSESIINNPHPTQSEHHTHQITNDITNEGQNTTGPPGATSRQKTHVNRRKRNKRNKRRTQASIRIATLNMNGCHTNNENRTTFEKWAEINATIKKEKIAILALQETHLDQEAVNNLHSIYKKRFNIHNSGLETAPRTSARVAFILNRELINPAKVEIMKLIAGRAIALKIRWKESTTTVINIYAPTRRCDNQSFWKELESRWERAGLPKPDFVLGDFNLTEEPIDRSPPRHDNAAAVDALRDMRRKMEIHDQWRHSYSKAREFTYRATQNQKQIKSRLDRIYTGKNAGKHTFDWKIKPSTVQTNHWMATVRFAPHDTPHIGKGRWYWPITALKDKKLMKEIISRGIKLQEDLQNLNGERENARNPQTLWENFKTDITALAQSSSRAAHYRRIARIKRLNAGRTELLNNPNFDDDEKLRWEEAIIANRIESLEQANSKTQRNLTKARIACHGEKMGGIWSNLSKTKKPRDTIKRLEIPNKDPKNYEVNSRRMAELAREYHYNLQTDEALLPENETENLESIERILKEIPEDQKLPPGEDDPASQLISESTIERAIKSAKNGSAAGLDGCPYELWKELNKRHINATKLNKQSFNIITTLTAIFQDIQIHGVDKKTDFAGRWMCPLYKKKDRSKIENYRPITLLNTDHKLLTKAMSIQLIQSIQKMIHRDQARFIPGRSIFDHIRLTKVMIKYAEAMETNSAIIALDQEKAYDKVNHRYLWKTMEAFRIPATLHNTVRSLYENASTMVVINGELSTRFKVT